eukprot:COSAG01_NODE_197_length_22333_cov_45.774759_10_plen_94_part_00
MTRTWTFLFAGTLSQPEFFIFSIRLTNRRLLLVLDLPVGNFVRTRKPLGLPRKFPTTSKAVVSGEHGSMCHAHAQPTTPHPRSLGLVHAHRRS